LVKKDTYKCMAGYFNSVLRNSLIFNTKEVLFKKLINFKTN